MVFVVCVLCVICIVHAMCVICVFCGVFCGVLYVVCDGVARVYVVCEV